jgi:hypothetical protein
MDEGPDGETSRWNGTLVRGVAPRPDLRVEACAFRRLSVVHNNQPLLWARIDWEHYGYFYLLSSREESLGVLPPIPFSETRAVSGAIQNLETDSNAWLHAWSKLFVSLLQETSGSCCASSRTLLGAGDRIWPDVADLSLSLSLPRSDYSAWDFASSGANTKGPVSPPPLPLRNFSSESRGRVKSFRKLARDGRLPPLLLWWISGLQRYVILDGHDRLLAATLVGVMPHWLALGGLRVWPLQIDSVRREMILRSVGESLGQDARTPGRQRSLSVEHANRILVGTFDERPHECLVTRAWPIPGGALAWNREVKAQLETLPQADCAMLDD